MTFPLKYVFCLLSVFYCTTFYAQNDTTFHERILLNKLKDAPKGTSVSVALIHGDTIEFIGLKQTKNGLIFCQNKDSVYEIGSITKVFTSTLLAHFVLEEKIKKDEKIKKHLDYKLNTKGKITFEHLANHTSGLPRLPANIISGMTAHPEDPYKGYTKAKLEDYLQHQVNLNNKPGKVHEYSNLGAGVLAYLLENISQKSYEELLSEYIFDVFGMYQTTNHIEKVKNQLVLGRTPDGKVTSNWTLEALAGAGQLYSSTSDLAKFIQAQFDTNNKALQLTHEKTFSVDDGLDIGLGWHILKNVVDYPVYFHNGGTGGYTSSCLFDKQRKVGVVVLTNVHSFSKADEICFSIFRGL